MFTPSCTVTAFLSDNGGAVSNSGSNWPLRGSKHTLWEGGVRVPALLAGPGIVPGTKAVICQCACIVALSF